MKRRISAAAAVTAALLLTAHSAAYGLFCSDVTAPAMQESSADLAEISAKFENALNAPETEPGTSEAKPPNPAQKPRLSYTPRAWSFITAFAASIPRWSIPLRRS